MRGKLSELLAFAAPHKAAISGALVLGLLGAVAALAQPLLVGEVLEAVRSGGSVANPATLLVILFVADAVFSGFQGYLMGKTGEGIVLGVRRTLVGRLLRMGVPQHDRRRTGDLLSRVGTDTTLLKTALSQSLSNVLVGTVVFVGAIVLMAIIDPVLLVAALLCVAVATAIVLVVATRIRIATEEAQQSVGALSSALERTLRAIRTVKISRAEEREEEAISGEAVSAYRAGVRVAGYEALVGPATNVALQGSFVLVLGLGGARLATGAISLGELVSFLLYLLYLVGPLVAVFVSFTEIQQGLAAVTRIREILAVSAEATEHPVEHRTQAERGRGGCEEAAIRAPYTPVARFERVSFGYAPERLVLEDLSFEIEGPGLTALVGPSGAGKSTVLALLERFYEPDAGTVELEGTDVRNLPLDELRRRVTYVEQDSPVMAGSVRENLLYAKPEATKQELEKIIDLVNLRPFVERLPEELDTEVGDGGVLLSGGERQRIAVGRMLLAEPRLLLLDEVTSQLDAQNERALRETISALAKRYAVVAVAHRLSTVKDAEKIILLEAGRVKATGTHQGLLKVDPLYRDLVHSQLIDGQG